MFPLRDNIPPRSLPFVNYGIIILSCVVFVQQLRAGDRGQDPFAEAYGMVPYRLTHPGAEIRIPERSVERFDGRLYVVERKHVIEPTPFNPWWTLLTCIFLHGGWLHLVGNMWFLHIFGDNVEDRFGHARYLLFYLVCGLAASLTHFVTNITSMVPTIGASGAIAGVMGAYLMLYPRAKVVAFVPLFVAFFTVDVPAPVFLGLWFLLQIYNGFHAFGAGAVEGVAWWAHIGGFMFGMWLVYWLGRRNRLKPAPKLRRAG